MKRYTFFSGETVLGDDLNNLEQNIEKGIVRVDDAFSLGAFPVRGLAASAAGGLVVGVTAGVGFALDVDGDPRLVRLLAPGTVDLTASLPAVNPKWVNIGLQFQRVNSGATVDDTEAVVNFINDEGSALVITAGVENAAPVKPNIPVDVVPICDVKLTVGMAAVLLKQLDASRARPAFARQGTPGGVAAQMLELAAASIDNSRVYGTDAVADLNVHVRPGRINYNGKWFTVAATDLAVATPAGGNKYIALVYVGTNGVAQVIYGAQVLLANAVTAPSHVGKLPLAEILVLDTTTAILPDDGTHGAAMIVDVRPFLKAAAETPRRYLLSPAIGGEAVIALGFSYVLGSNSLMAFKDGVKLIGGGVDYTETDASTITLTVAMVAAHKLEVVAPVPGEINPVVTHASTHAAGGSDPIDYTTLGGLVAPGFLMFTTGDNAITIRPFSAFIIDSLVGSMRTAAVDLALAPPTLGNNAWWYVYAWWSAGAGAIQIEYSATGPDVYRRFKTGDTTRTYLGAFISTSTGKVKAFTRSNRRTTFKWDRTAAAGSAIYGLTKTVANPGDALAHVLDLSLGFPPHAKMARLFAQAIGGVSGTDSYDILDNGAAGQGSVRNVPQLNGTAAGYLEVPLDTQGAQYKASINVGVVLNIWADGWDD